MTLIARFFNSTLGKKYIMAITGFLLFGFVIVHMLGNLQIFAGPNAINEYAELLKSKAALLWGARLGLLAITVLHIVTAIQLVLRNRAARPVRYGMGAAPVGASLSSRTAAISGTIILAFIVFHLLHYTVGAIYPEYLALRDAQGRHDVFGMVIAGFSNPLVSVFYLVAMALLCLHLRHGVSSMFQSLGLKSGAYDAVIDRVALVASAAIFLGNCAIVIAVLAGLVKSS
jgi:succinate dehydrogenase / fumarate reductase, cytochrome b subunit